MVTKTPVVMGDPQVTTTPRASAGSDAARVRQGDRRAGGRRVDAGASKRSPMTYAIDGKQYVVVAISGDNYSGEYLSFTLPASSASR